MLKHLLPLAALLTAALPAQVCPDRAMGTFLGIGDDTMFPMQSIGFTFPFAGTTYTDVHVCANGYLFLSNAGVPAPPVGDYTSTPGEMSLQGPRISVLWCDLNHTAANNAGIYVNSTPAKCTVTWYNAINYGMTTVFTLQAELFPTGEVKMYWGDGATNNTTFNYLAGNGITGVSPGGGATIPAPSDLSVGGNTTDDFLFEQWALQGTFDMPLRSLHLIPTAPGWVYIATPWTGCASSTDYGTGCVTNRDSFYEIMAPAAFDLANTRMRLVRGTAGYTASIGVTASYVVPTASAQIIANLDDTTQTVALGQAMPVPGGTTTQLTVSSNGNIALSATGNGAGFAPDVGLFLAFAQTSIAASWHDYNPALAGSGKILFEQVGTIAYVTWDGVYSYLTSLPDRFQYQFDLTTGNVTIVYETFGLGSAAYLVGYSRGGVGPRPEESDVSVDLATPLFLFDTSAQGLTLTGTGLPTVGNATYTFAVSAVPNIAPLAILFFGDQPAPGIDLTFLGMAGCRGYSNANLTSVTIPVQLPAGTGSQALPIPNNLGLIGTVLSVQAAAFSLATQLNLVTSNGTLVTVGL